MHQIRPDTFAASRRNLDAINRRIARIVNDSTHAADTRKETGVLFAVNSNGRYNAYPNTKRWALDIIPKVA